VHEGRPHLVELDAQQVAAGDALAGVQVLALGVVGLVCVEQRVAFSEGR